MEKNDISISVIKRLPRYYRFLETLKSNGIVRISSKELAERMGLTASQIRHDFNCFGGFGQQGYGYNVPELYNKIGEILCVNNKVKTILIGAGNLGRAVSSKIFTRDSGFQLVGIFDKNEAISGKIIHGIPVRHTDYLENFCIDNAPKCAVICIPSNDMKELTDLLCKLGITSFWNFSNYDIAMAHPEVLVENVHLTDSLMTLSYLTNEYKEQNVD
ncbi:MAG: redox-sensing transcriptional repressor Rex [Eubacterium sp.]|nr:redox-sensing transcriptional repressor Rex [Eubacterium sp.]MBQ8981278.1 redox-sensing transcriptional repressor Rex [Eubacterium sp.]MBR1531152.1 redox-sensing transcriptional repressor Rex [Eubacterium sp.]MBR2278549.1 redox-sensing transcriptional repressor Rex [Eubacterium sp.]